MDWLETLFETEFNQGDLLCETFENLYNTLTCARTFDENAISCGEIEFEVYKIYIWELFICIVTFLRYFERLTHEGILALGVIVEVSIITIEMR